MIRFASVPLRRFSVGTLFILACSVVIPTTIDSTGAQTRQRQVQQSDTTQQDDQLRLGTDLVLLDVTVVDQSNRPLYDLPESDFTILEDGVQQKIEFFSKENASVSLGIAIDTSGSMRSKLETVIQASTNLVAANQPADETAVIEFKDQVELIEEFTTNENDVEDALGDLIANGQTALLDAIRLASDYVQTDGHHRRKALVVVTDGLEKGSYYSLDQIVDHLRELDVRLYLIGFTQDLEKSGGLFKKSDRSKAEDLLNKLAEETGGRSFFPKDLSELGSITDQIAKDLRTVYAIGYSPTNIRKDGTFRKIEVKVTQNGRKSDKIVARTRSGYYADKE